ncbi:Rap1a/Tai family immunity protein [Alkalimonas sp. MEB108]|uniref:Rap1a/Tai family immunity protein n=1 Tax=Alkalimonas cellulosilytica TaxID=3058395 RepID=A0ABU7J0S8_9GAMM|nr:Rap1a/Tai family immunity protein [Alkalimonas sp. MEB108]MEE1999943.1 Rap1a/Tai family immunity protein [Alkalimonas sp. MEB108]
MQLKLVTAIPLLLITVASCTVAGTSEDNARVPFDRLLALANGQPLTPLPPSFSERAKAGIAQDQLNMYLAGVIDSKESHDWCVAKSGLPPHEVNQLLLAELQQDYEQQKVASRDNAAVLVAKKLRILFPCSSL